MKMDNLMLRFPHLFEQTFQKLNNESLFKSREVARSWKHFINGRNYPWLCVVNIPTILQQGDSYLHLAAETGQIDAFETALSKEEDKDVKSIYGQTSFHHACKKGRLNIVEYLLENANLNVDINAKDNSSWTGFIFACFKGHLNVAKVLVDRSVALGIDLNAQSGSNLTAFMWACMKGHASIVKMIMEYSFGTMGIALNMDNRFGD